MAKSRDSKAKYFPLILVPVALLIALGYYLWERPKAVAPATDPYLPKAENGKSTAPSMTTTSPSPIPTSTAPQASKNGEVIITSPTQGASVMSGTTVTGTAKTTSNRLYYRLKGGKSGQLALGSVEFAGNNTTSTKYSFELAFTNQVASGGDQGVLEVFTLGTDGSEQTIAGVTVNIQP